DVSPPPALAAAEGAEGRPRRRRAGKTVNVGGLSLPTCKGCLHSGARRADFRIVTRRSSSRGCPLGSDRPRELESRVPVRPALLLEVCAALLAMANIGVHGHELRPGDRDTWRDGLGVAVRLLSAAEGVRTAPEAGEVLADRDGLRMIAYGILHARRAFHEQILTLSCCSCAPQRAHSFANPGVSDHRPEARCST